MPVIIQYFNYGFTIIAYLSVFLLIYILFIQVIWCHKQFLKNRSEPKLKDKKRTKEEQMYEWDQVDIDLREFRKQGIWNEEHRWCCEAKDIGATHLVIKYDAFTEKHSIKTIFDVLGTIKNKYNYDEDCPERIALRIININKYLEEKNNYSKRSRDLV